ncbi:MAG: hypothetical protein AAF694_15380 [Bacteroidota bacterium]
MKIILKTLKWLIITLFASVFLLLLFLLLDAGAQKEIPTFDPTQVIAIKEYQAPEDSSLYDSLFASYGTNKELPKGFELQALIALSHYPELVETPIEFRIEPAFIPLSSRPDPITVVFPWIKRKYLVVISNESADFFEPILMHNLPFNEQIGVVGHELAHTVFYLDKSSLQLAQIAYQYEYNNEYKIPFERETDQRAILHGLGYQLYDYSFFTQKSFGRSLEEIKAMEGNMYLGPTEITREMERYEFYRDTLDTPESYF